MTDGEAVMHVTMEISTRVMIDLTQVYLTCIDYWQYSETYRSYQWQFELRFLQMPLSFK